METLYGKYPKKITCQCNAGEMDGDADTILLNDRCPICHSVRKICIPKPEERMKAGFGIANAQKAKEPVLIAQKEIEPLVEWDQVFNYHFNQSYAHFSYFMTLSGMFWTYAWAFLTFSPEMLHRKS